MQVIRDGNVDSPPIWLMRQAGRYLPEYRAVREKHSFLDLCNTPELAVEVSLQPIRRFDFDAAILFSDILVPLVPMGAELTFGAGHGPLIANPLRNAADINSICSINPEASLDNVLETIRTLRRELPAKTALIGFAGAPFTLATYWIEGGKPDPFMQTKMMMYREPKLFASLLTKLGNMVADYLVAQARAGADAVQIFDTWAGILPAHEYRRYNLPILKEIFARLKAHGIPTTYYAKESGHLLAELAELGSDVVSLDWKTPLDQAAGKLGQNKILQGNLDPTVLFGDEATIRTEARRVVSEAKSSGRHIFNLGHGILPGTPISSVEILIDEVRRRVQ